MDVLGPARKYPGRNRIMSRESARDYLFRQRCAENSAKDPLLCSSPLELQAIGLPSAITEDTNPLTLQIAARCRRCPECLAHRRRLWMARALDELKVARRTWFGTLTVSPEERFKLKLRAEARRLRAGGETVSSLDGAEQYRLFADYLGQEVTKWLKRVRSVAKGPLRYLLVFEAHKDGFPHVHLLLHEQGEPISKRELEKQWRYGFSHWRLVGDNPQAAHYVCKYLAKDALTRVRASSRYGQKHLVRRSTETLEEIVDAIRAREGEKRGCGFSQGSGATGKGDPRSGVGEAPLEMEKVSEANGKEECNER